MLFRQQQRPFNSPPSDLFIYTQAVFDRPCPFSDNNPRSAHSPSSTTNGFDSTSDAFVAATASTTDAAAPTQLAQQQQPLTEAAPAQQQSLTEAAPTQRSSHASSTAPRLRSRLSSNSLKEDVAIAALQHAHNNVAAQHSLSSTSNTAHINETDHISHSPLPPGLPLPPPIATPSPTSTPLLSPRSTGPPPISPRAAGHSIPPHTSVPPLSPRRPHTSADTTFATSMITCTEGNSAAEGKGGTDAEAWSACGSEAPCTPTSRLSALGAASSPFSNPTLDRPCPFRVSVRKEDGQE